MAPAVLVVELRLGDGVVHVDRREQEDAVALHLVQAVDAGGGLLGDAADLGGQLGPLLGAVRDGAVQEFEDDAVLVGLGGVQGGDLAGLLVLDALVDEEGGVAAVVQDHVGAAGGAVRPGQRLLGAPPVLVQRLALPGVDGDAAGVVGGAVGAYGDGGGGVVLGGEDVAGGPADLGAQGDEGLDEDGGLHGHVQGAGDAGAGEGLGLGVLLADGHQAGHLVLGEGDLLAAELGQGEVGDLEVLPVFDSRHGVLLLGIGSRWVRLVCAAARRHGGAREGTGVPRGVRVPECAQRSPSEALSPSAGP